MTGTVDMAVRKGGRTTGLTYGRVTSVDATISINYGDGLGSHTLKNQVRICAGAHRLVLLGADPSAWSSGARGGGFSPGLMSGLAGTMYLLARTASPAAVSSLPGLGG